MNTRWVGETAAKRCKGGGKCVMGNSQSKLQVSCYPWMCSVSSTRLLQQFPLISYVHQSTWCWFVQEWTAISILVSCFFTVFLVSNQYFLKGFACFSDINTFHSLCMVLHRWQLSSSCLLWDASHVLGNCWGCLMTCRQSSVPVVNKSS